MRLVYFGSGDLGLPVLHRLVGEHDVVLAVTQPDRLAGRRRRLRPTPVRAAAEQLGVPTLAVADVNDPAEVQRIGTAAADVYVVIAFGQKLGRALLDGPPAINLHASLLPRYRGAAPINWAIINGERETGLTVIRMSERIDAGAILARRATPIDPMETAGELAARLADMGPELVMDVLESWQTGSWQPQPQDGSRASAAPKLAKAQGTVRFDQPAVCVRQRVHGLTPWPGCRVRLDGHELRLVRVEVAEGVEVGDPGTVADGLVACRPGAVRPLEVQPAGGRLMPFAAWCRGHRLDPAARMEPL